MRSRIELEYQRMVLEHAIEQFGEAVECFYDKKDRLKKDSAEYTLANNLFETWQQYLAHG